MLTLNLCQLGQNQKTWQNTYLERLEKSCPSFLRRHSWGFALKNRVFCGRRPANCTASEDKKTKQIISKTLQKLDNLPLRSQSTKFTKVFWTWFKEQIYLPLYTEKKKQQVVLNKHYIQLQKSRKLLSMGIQQVVLTWPHMVMKSKGETM